MSERFFPVSLAAISETIVRLKWVSDQEEYDAFIAEFKKPGVEIREHPSMEALYIKKMSKYFPGIKGWSDKTVDPDFWIPLVGPD